MKYLEILIALLPSIANAGVFSTERVQPYPAEWPVLSGMSETCLEVQGTYIDSNRWRWEREEFPGSPLGSKYGGSLEAAWMALGFEEKDVRSQDRMVKFRAFNVAFDPDQSVTVTYLLDEKVVAVRNFARDKVSCTREGLTIAVLERSFDVPFFGFPNKGKSWTRSTLYKNQNHLYVKTIQDTKATVAHVVPQSFLNVYWFRFHERDGQ
jgi:hypothetical protein